jgi:hypothetical protein
MFRIVSSHRKNGFSGSNAEFSNLSFERVAR